MRVAMPALEEIRPLRRAEYDQLVELGAFHGEKIELLEGWLVEMSPIGPRHSSTVQKLTALLVPALAGRASVRIQLPYAASESSEPEPDVAVVPLGDYDTEHPSQAYLVIEVAQSSLGRDRGLKRSIYARSGVPEYWIVNLVDKSIEVYSNPADGDYASKRCVAHSESVSLSRFPEISLRVAGIVK